MDLVVDQQGVDVGLTFTAPDGTKLGELDSPNGDFGPEPLCWLASAGGEYRLDVAPGAPKTPEGKYRIAIRALRAPSEVDRLRAQGQAVFLEAETLRGQRKADASKSAVSLYEKASRLFREAGDPQGEARAVFSLAGTKDNLGLVPENLALLQRTLELLPAIGDPGFEASTLTWMGLATQNLGDPTAAITLFDRAAGIEDRQGNNPLLGFTLGARGLTSMMIGDHEGATRSFLRSRDIMRTFGDRRAEAIISNNLALLADEIGELDEALSAYEYALTIEKEIQDKNNEAITRNNMGLVYGKRGEWRKALGQHELALPLRREVGSRFGEAYTLNNLGVAHGKLGETDKAEAELASALELRRQVGDRRGESTTLEAIGALRLDAGRASEALQSLEKALEIRRSIADLVGQAETLASMARASRSIGDLESARRRADEAVAVVESRRHLIATSVRPSYLGEARRYYELQIDLLLSGKRGNDRESAARALDASERSRARSLIELLAESHANIRQGVDERLLASELSVRRRLASKLEEQTRMLAARHTDEQASTVAAAVESLLGDLRDVEGRIREASPRYAALTSAEPLRTAALQELLDADTVLLEYALGDERSFLWAIEPSSVAVFELPARAPIEAAARKLYERWIQRPAAATARRESPDSGPEIAKMLLGPVADRLAGKRLVIVPDGALAFLSFAALPLPGADGRRLVAEHEIVVLPSASTLAFLRSDPRRAVPPMTLAVLADPVFERNDPRVRRRTGSPAAGGSEPASPSRVAVERSIRDTGAGEGLAVERLPFSRREANAILALVPPASRRASLDFAANRAAALGDDVSSYRYVHFATHAFSNALHPELSGLVLSLVDRQGHDQEGFVAASEVFNLKLSADLVVLSACRTALGKEVRGEGLLGLTRAFMYAGAPRVVASLWRVDDAATAELMTRFYGGMLGPQKLRPAAALRAAQNAVRGQERWRDPYFWAGFVLQGDWR